MERSLFTRLEMFILTNVIQIVHKEETIALTCVFMLSVRYLLQMLDITFLFLCVLWVHAKPLIQFII